MLIEDDKLCLFVAQHLFSELTPNIDSAETVKEALEKLGSKRYDLVVSDIRLPDGSGKDIVAKIKATPGSLNYQTPFVALSVNSDRMTYQQVMADGFLILWTNLLTIEKAVMLLKTYLATKNL